MPKIVINEIDNTVPGERDYSNFSVVVPGLVKESSNADEKQWKDVCDDNNICVFTDANVFKSICGTYNINFDETTAINSAYTDSKDSAEIKNNDKVICYTNGNQIAYELLLLGYTVIYKKIDNTQTAQDVDNPVKDAFWEPLKDKSLYDFRYVISGMLLSSDNAINQQIANLVKQAEDKVETISLSNRTDAIALCDIPDELFKKDYEVITDSKTNAKQNLVRSYSQRIGAMIEAGEAITADRNVAIFAPAVKYTGILGSSYYSNKYFPASFHYLACAIRSLQNYAEWYAVSGFTRGISNYIIESVGLKIGDSAVNQLQPRIADASETSSARSINVIANISGEYYMWGNRTAEALDSKGLTAKHFLNIRQLCVTIKKQLFESCRKFMFDPNSDVLWFNFKNSITPILEKMKADQGIRDYRISREDVNNQKALLKAIIRIVPIEAVEDFDISLYLEDSIAGTINIEG